MNRTHNLKKFYEHLLTQKIKIPITKEKSQLVLLEVTNARNIDSLPPRRDSRSLQTINITCEIVSQEYILLMT